MNSRMEFVIWPVMQRIYIFTSLWSNAHYRGAKVCIYGRRVNVFHKKGVSQGSFKLKDPKYLTSFKIEIPERGSYERPVQTKQKIIFKRQTYTINEMVSNIICNYNHHVNMLNYLYDNKQTNIHWVIVNNALSIILS